MDFKKLSDMFTLAVPVLIVCSCIRLLTYYNHWSIPILDYLSASEILLLFIQPVLVIAALAAVYFAFTVLLTAGMLLLVKLGIVAKGNDKAKEEKPRSEPAAAAKPSIYTTIFSVVTVGGIVVVIVKGMWFDYEVFPAVISHVFLLIGTFAVVRSVLPASEQQDVMKPLVAGTLVVLISASFFYGRFQARRTETNPTRLELALRDQALLKTDPDRIYVGKTSSYYFFHSKNETSIIPVGEVRATYIK
jgi:hypothetical protein